MSKRGAVRRLPAGLFVCLALVLALVLAGEARAEGPLVAVVDSGVDATHPDLAQRVAEGCNVWDGGDTHDACGHGTNIAGVMAEAAPAARILPVKAMSDDCYGTYSRLIAGVECAVEMGAQVILIASGAYFDSPALHAAVSAARQSGVLLVAGAGNDGTAAPFYPAAYEEVVTVAGVDRLGAPYWRTNYGPHVDIAGPALEVRCAAAGGGYDVCSGTSSAGAYVAGAAAHVWALRPEWKADEVAAHLCAVAVDCIAPDQGAYCGCGRVNVERAVRLALPLHVHLPVLLCG
ncbi:MAG: S8 family serine peptidase [Chloroflexota bacterium]|nr:S8 family serine peptidase [Chloroflexota bacterium]